MSYRLFIADDSEVLCNHLLEKFLEFEDLNVVGVTHNFSDTIKQITQTKPDAIILDIQMPGGTGIDILDHIKKNQPSNKVIIFTNYPYPQYRQRCMEAGADFFFDKHTEFTELFRVVKRLIKESNSRRSPLIPKIELADSRSKNLSENIDN